MDNKKTSQQFYNKRKKERPSLEVIDTVNSIKSLIKSSNQISDPFSEKAYANDVIKTPYNFLVLLNFFEDNTWNNACINIKSQLVCGRFKVTPIEKDKKEDAEFKILNEFIENPNEDDEDFVDILNKLWIDYESIGNAYIEVVRNFGGLISEIYHVPAHTVRKAKDRSGYYHIRKNVMNDEKVYFKKWNDKNDSVKANEIIHLKNYFPASKYYGLPDFMPALGAMSLDRNSVIFNNQYFVNSGMIGQILSLAGAKLTPDARAELKNMVQNNYTGVTNAHRMAIIDNLKLGSEFKIEKVMESAKDMSFLNLRKFNRDEIIASHRVPPKLLHIAQPGSLGQVQDGWNQMQMFKEFEIEPSQNRLERLLKKVFKIELSVTNWYVEFEEMNVRSPKEINEELTQDINSGVRTVDEAREERGLPEREETATQKPPQPVPFAINKQEDFDKILQQIDTIEKEIIGGLGL